MNSKNFKFIALFVLIGLVNLGSSNPVDPTPAVAPAHPADPVHPVVDPAHPADPVHPVVDPVTQAPTPPPTQAPTPPPTPAPTSAPVVQLCKGHPDGEYIIDPLDHHVYYQCMRSHAIKFTCPESALQGRLVFDPVKKVCIFPPDA